MAFGMFPLAWRARCDAVSVNAWIQSTARPLFAPIGTARSEPPRKLVNGFPFSWLGITNWLVTPLYLSPTQQLNHEEPITDAA